MQNLSNELLSIVAVESLKHDALAVAGGMFGLARLFLMLRFHPRLSLVTDVLAASAVHLVHFFIMFFVVVGVYRYTATRSVKDYRVTALGGSIGSSLSRSYFHGDSSCSGGGLVFSNALSLKHEQ